MELKLGDIAGRLGAVLEGDGELMVEGVAGLGDAGPKQITFLANLKYAADVPRTRAAGIIVPPDYHGETSATLLRMDDPRTGFMEVLRLFSDGENRREPGVHPSAVVHPSVKLGARVSIGALCVIEEGAVLDDDVVLCPGVFVGHGAAIGEGAFVHPNVTLREGVRLGKRVIVHSGTVIGSDGFGYTRRGREYEKIPQVGTVLVEDDVEIGANVAIDRGTMGATRIGRGVKIDNLVHVAHNVTVGENTLLVAQVGIAGSTRVGCDVTMAGQSGATGHVQIGDGVMVGAQAGVTKNVPDGARVSGYPAMDHVRAKRLNAYMRRLPEMFEELKRLGARLREIEGNSGETGEAPGAKRRAR
jgi:UDP-3-O-[3-hydroxymyristoyl] glucosamine N-acyltransferase